jgi:putative Ca2+/H+ antiporter (TMEM165/GDT1 family)
MLEAFTAGLLLITISELGDKTFFIAMILAMRYPFNLVFPGVTAALTTMTILSVGMGQILKFLPQKYTHYTIIGLFIVFGIKLLYDASKMSNQPNCQVIKEAELAVAECEQKAVGKLGKKWSVIVEGFVLTFLAEWGDRTQITTIGLAASQNALGVTTGAILGHAICALIAVVGGRLVAGKISEKLITAIGGVIFLVFALASIVNGENG